MSSKPEFVYFDGRGLGEIVRIVLCGAGIQFTDTSLKSRDQFLSFMPELLFNQVPLLRIDGQSLVQSRSIVRYIGRKHNLLGNSDLEAARVDQLFEGTRDLFRCFLGFAFADDSEVTVAVEKDLDKYFPIFDKVLKDNNTGYLVGSSLTIADLGLFEVVEATIDYFGKARFESFSGIKLFYEKVTSLESIQRYLQEVRKRKNDGEYIASVNEILAKQ